MKTVLSAVIVLAALTAIGTTSLAHGSDACAVQLAGNDAMKFDKSALTVSSQCETVTIELTHTGKLGAAVMGHNVVVTLGKDLSGVASDGVKAGAGKGYVPENDPRVIGASNMIGGGEKTTLIIPGDKLTAGEDYVFFCSFPGHWTMMKGKLVVGG